jgi:hypothetical protein
MVLTFNEIKRIGEWKPYRDVWDFGKELSTQDEEEVERHYEKVTDCFLQDSKFECIQNQDGGMSNYLSFLCYPRQSHGLHIDNVIVFISLFAPIATYGQGSMHILEKSHGWTDPSVSELGMIRNDSLKEIEKEVQKILLTNGIEILGSESLNRELTSGLTITENLHLGDKMFNYLFQWID